MFPLQPRDELVFVTPSLSQPDNLIPDINLLIVDHAISGSNISFSSSDHRGDRETQFVNRQRQTNGRDENNIKRIIHRDLERQRRQEMAQLHASLRSLLPLDHIKGKRSVCDHMREAVNYIKHKQNHIEKLKNRRDELKKLSNVSATEIGSNGSDNLPCNSSVMVNLDRNGVEILISSTINNLKLSRVFKELIQRQINVFSCVSSKTNEGFLHKIEAEAVDLTSLDPSLLQERLIHLIN
ncbi:hypothetical protein BUALT_Bualt06G0120600 [Buddleja alternifolia]|uniref:BHLH domain-containing protein n=1 Tax=Buddleja alternifolia TaxID=168488 RepID=A0AAV6XMG5_9LAMI|nr:hypothetical protein BUALT_Bualt06G0120600 [Buddleja alternifolia]